MNHFWAFYRSQCTNGPFTEELANLHCANDNMILGKVLLYLYYGFRFLGMWNVMLTHLANRFFHFACYFVAWPKLAISPFNLGGQFDNTGDALAETLTASFKRHVDILFNKISFNLLYRRHVFRILGIDFSHLANFFLKLGFSLWMWP